MLYRHISLNDLQIEVNIHGRVKKLNIDDSAVFTVC